MKTRIFSRCVVAIGLSFTCLVSCGGSGPVTVPVVYLPQDNLIEAVSDCARFHTVWFDDSRSNPSAIGTRFRDDDPSEKWDILASNELTPVLEQATARAFRTAMVKRLEGSNADVKVSLAQVQIEEKSRFLSSYVANVVIDVQIFDKASKQLAWKTRKSGSGEALGDVASEDRYAQALSGALEVSLGKLLKDPEFSATLCQIAGAS